MPLIDRSLLDIPARRQRKEIPNASLQELKSSIVEQVLLHAPVVQKVGERFVLVAGERRTRAIDLLAAEGRNFTYDKIVVVPGQFPCVELDEAFSALRRSEIEYAENIIRVELPWQDKVEALAYMHTLRVAANPSQTVIDTAREIVATGNTEGASTSAVPAATVSAIRQNISEANVIVKHLDDPAIAKARNATEAFNLIIAKEERAFQAELIRRGTKKITSVEVRHGSLLEILPKLDSGIVDTIFCDPPYGISVDSAGFRSRTVHHHNYDDTPDAARAVLSCIVHEGFRICRPRANLFIMCDIDLFGWLKECCARAGWEPFRTPITWGKSDSEGMAPWGREGFRRTTEWILFARKGQKGLFHSPIDYLRHNRVGRDEREYGPEKPVSLIKEILAASTLPGELVLDPCCGSGSTLAAARELNMRAIGIELDERAYNIALVKSQTEAPKEAPKEGLEAL
jgi:site-specific DNA-methyltransferase (adenine-specific)